MVLKNETGQKKLSILEVSEILKVNVETVRYWEKKGLVKSYRQGDGFRLFDLAQIRQMKKRFVDKKAAHAFRVFKSKPSKHNVVELFTGAGGLALGLSNAGFKTELLVEFDKDAVATIRRNKPNWNCLHEDIRKVCFKKHKNKIDVVAGGFPCQAFSYAGSGRGFGDIRGTLFFEFARSVEEIKPKIALGENVRGLVQHDNGRTLKTMIAHLEELGYRVEYRLLRAQYLDVAQKRERLIILAVRNDLSMPFVFPKEKNYCLTLRDVLNKCPKSEGVSYPERKHFIMAKVPEGGYWRDLPLNLQKEYMRGSFYLGGGKTGMARRLAWDEPSLTLVCTPAQGQTERCHPSETRPLTVRESARIQSFPDTWQFEGSMASKYKQIGNAVPVNMAYQIGRCLLAMLDRKFDANTMLIQDSSKKQPELCFAA